jgi:flagellum-specific peptidoglycan hydrolase FlgJ
VHSASKPLWQQATAVVSLGASGAITGFTFVPKAAADLTSPTGMNIRLLALRQAGQPAPATDAMLRSAIVDSARYYLRMAADKTPAEMEAIIWQHDSSDGADHGASCAAFASLTLELGAQVVGQQSWVTGGTSYPWPLSKWADVRVDPNPDSLGIVSIQQDARAHDRWHPIGDGYQPLPGDWVLFAGHVEVVTDYADGVLRTIGADSLPDYSVNAHQYRDPLPSEGVAGFVNNGELSGAGSEPAVAATAHSAGHGAHESVTAGQPAIPGTGTASSPGSGPAQKSDNAGTAATSSLAPASPASSTTAPGQGSTSPPPSQPSRGAAAPGSSSAAGQAPGGAAASRSGHPARVQPAGGAAIPGVPALASGADSSPGQRPSRRLIRRRKPPERQQGDQPDGARSRPGGQIPAGQASPGGTAIAGIPGAGPAAPAVAPQEAARGATSIPGLPGTSAGSGSGPAAPPVPGISPDAGTGPAGSSASGTSSGPSSGAASSSVPGTSSGPSSGAARSSAPGAASGSAPAGSPAGPSAGPSARPGATHGQKRRAAAPAGPATPVPDISAQQAFIAELAPAAIESQRKYGVPASVTIAQAIDESAWGQSTLATRDHNLFGIKGTGPAGSDSMPTLEYENGQPVTREAPFRVYRDLAESIDDHGKLLATSPYYRRPMADSKDPNAFAAALTGIYATDPDYGAKLIGLMHQYNLYRYDGTAPAARPHATATPSGASIPGLPGATPAARASTSPGARPAKAATAAAGHRSAPAHPPPTATPSTQSVSAVRIGPPDRPRAVVPPRRPQATASARAGRRARAASSAGPSSAWPGGSSESRGGAGSNWAQASRSQPSSSQTSSSQTSRPRATGPAPARNRSRASTSKYRQEMPAMVKTAFLTTARVPLLRQEPLYRDVAAGTGIRWELLAACDWMQCEAQPRFSPVHGEKLGKVTPEGMVYPTKSAALEQCANDLADLAWAVYQIDLTRRSSLSVLELANAFAAFRWGGLLRLHHTSAMEFPYSVAGLTEHHLNMRWPKIPDSNLPDKPGGRFRRSFGAVPIVLGLRYPATV